MGDVAEVNAIKRAFTNTSHIKMNATKSMIGHCLGAAAGIEAIASVMAIKTGWLHPTLNQHNLIDEVAGIDTVPNVKKQHKVRELCQKCESQVVTPSSPYFLHLSQITAALSNSFGFGGHNSACIFAPFVE